MREADRFHETREEPPHGRISQTGKVFLMVENNGGKFFIMHLCIHAN